MRSTPVLLLGLFLLCPIGLTDAYASSGQLQAQAAELVVKLDDGRTLRGEALIGLSFVLAGPAGDAEIRIDGIDMDTKAVGGPLPLYRLSMVVPGGLERADYCWPDPTGRRAGLVLADPSGNINFTCTSGGEGKCILMGYRPWETANGVPSRDLHQACIHMMRADYGGDNRPSTRDGTLIDIYDRFGIQKPEMIAGMQFEAAWGPDGAVCVAHPRIADNISLEDIGRRYPALAGSLGPASCNEDTMKAEPRALLFNRSPAPLP